MNVKNTKVIYLNSKAASDDTEYFLTIKDILKQRVDIPTMLFINDYQRPYCWGKKQIEELINDIDGCSNNSNHFAGVLYFGKNVSNHGCSVIDGQQRLITIFLILKYLNADENFKIYIKIDNEESCKYFSLDSMLDGDISRNLALEISENNLLKEYKKNVLTNSKKHIEKIIEGLQLNKDKFKEKLLNRIYFLAIKCDDSNTENILFRIVNAKGQLLDDIDKIKSFLLSNYYGKNEDTKHFIELWAKLNKSGKKSLNIFFKILMNDLTENQKNSSGKIKYEKFEREAKQCLDFKSRFEHAIERFEWIPTDFKNFGSKFNKKPTKKPSTWKNIQASCFLINKLGLRDKFTSEIGDSKKFNDYKDGTRSAILLFMLYLLTYICETNYSFSGTDNINKIDEFQAMSENDRKLKLLCLFEKFKKEEKIKDIQYKQKDVNDEDDKINQKHKCLYPLLLLITRSSEKDFYETISQFEKFNLHKDHYIPKIINEKSVPRKERATNFSCPKITPEFKKEYIAPIYNCRLLSEAGNINKKNIMPHEFRVLDENKKCTGFDFDKIKISTKNRREIFMQNFESLVAWLTKSVKK